MVTRKKSPSVKPQVTIVIGTLNRPDVVLKLLNQLKKEKNAEVLVIDQSAKENFKKLKAAFPSAPLFKLIHFDKPNTCRYLNYGWKNAKANIVLYLDDDVTITDTTISGHLRAYRSLRVQAAAGRVINDGEIITKGGSVGKVLWFGAQFEKNFTSQNVGTVDFPYGCNMSFRKSALEALRGFDENLHPPMYTFNEIDMGLRVNKRWNNSIQFVPEALVYHHQYKTGGTRNNFALQDVARGNSFNYGYFVGKNYSWIENFFFLVRRLPYQLFKEPGAIGDIARGFIAAKKIPR